MFLDIIWIQRLKSAQLSNVNRTVYHVRVNQSVNNVCLSTFSTNHHNVLPALETALIALMPLFAKFVFRDIILILKEESVHQVVALTV